MTGAQDLTALLGGRWRGRYGNAPCPVCQPEARRDQAALTLSDGSAGLLAFCHKSGCGFRDIIAAAGVTGGDYCAPDPGASTRREAERRVEMDKRAAQAERLWRETTPLTGTVAETYLRVARGISCALPGTLRFHPACWHGATARRYPALVALVSGGDGFAVHRTYLHADGMEKADIAPDKAMLGAVAGGAVWLSEGVSRLAVAEGIETALSLCCGLLRGPSSVWAALSTSGMRSLRLPNAPGQLTIASDGDAAGRATAQVLAVRAHGLGWQVSLLPAPDGRDWNDLLAIRGEAT